MKLRLYFFLITVGAILLVLVCARALFTTSLDKYPASWQKIQIGDSYAEVKKKYPGLDDGMHSIKGVDMLVEEDFTGRWVTYYWYRDDKISSKSLNYCLGTEKDFHLFHLANEHEGATP